MAYTKNPGETKVGFFARLKVKTGKILAKRFPYNRVRVWGLKLCGFEIGKQVYIGEDLIVASMISERSCWLKI